MRLIAIGLNSRIYSEKQKHYAQKSLVRHIYLRKHHPSIEISGDCVQFYQFNVQWYERYNCADTIPMS